MKKDNTLLVLSRKFNDIFYSVSTAEWNCFNRHVLVVFADKEFAQQFPLLGEFDDIVFLNSPKSRKTGIIQELKSVKMNKMLIQCDAIMLSNPVLVVNQYLVKISNARQIFLLEDGLINYIDFHPSNSLIKGTLQRILGLDQQKLINSISCTYLFAPELAHFYGGRRVKLNLKSQRLSEEVLAIVSGKRIFVGQTLYRFGYISIEEYNERVNRIIEKYNIDYYLPHAFALDIERINCPILNIGEFHTTLEILASQSKFVLFSFFSSVLYTTRVINPNIETYLINISEVSEMSKASVIEKYCSGIINF